MKQYFVDDLENRRNGIRIVTITLLFFIFRMAIPLFKYPFLITYTGLLVYVAFFKFRTIKQVIKEFLSVFSIILVLFVILIVSFVLSHKIYLIEFKDIINGIVLFSLFFILIIFVHDRQFLKFFNDYLISIVPVFALLISIVGFLYFFDIITHEDFLFNNTITEIRKNSSSLLDYNFSLLPVFFGFISVLFISSKSKTTHPGLFSSLLLVLFSFQILLSGSRRGLFLLLIIIILLLVLLIFFDKNRSSVLKSIAKESIVFIFLFIVVVLSIFIFITKTPYDFKNRFLERIGSKNILITKDKIAKQVWRYTSIIDRSPDFQKTYNLLWSPAFNPKDPDSGWGSRIHTTVYPLTGKNNEIVPEGSRGYQMDWTCDATYYPDIDLSESYSLITVIDAKAGDTISASVFCFVSDDFEGSLPGLTVSSISIGENLVSGNFNSYYDTDKKGEWQKLDINFTSKEAHIPIYISFVKSGVRDFMKLKGKIIFAYPQFNKNSKTDTKAISFSGLKVGIQRYNSSGFFNFQVPETYKTDSLKNRNDIVRNIVAKIISEDTTYFGYKNKLLVDINMNKYGDERLVRWMFAIQIFTKEYSLGQKIFGGGFDFLNWYGYYFLKDKKSSDWPHNPFLAVLLYSGILGLLIYCFFMYKVFFYYLKYIKEYPLLFIFFLITFFFSFFSGGSPFDPPIMGFFGLLPFFIHSIHKKEKESFDLKTNG